MIYPFCAITNGPETVAIYVFLIFWFKVEWECC